MNNDSQNPIEEFPKDSEAFGNIRNDAEPFGNLPKPSEREESHTLTVREVARIFERAGVPRTERSIINWCQPNKLGVPRLNSYFDPNERKYFITPQSVELAIREEQAKATKDDIPSVTGGAAVQRQQREGEAARDEDTDANEARTLKQEILDLKITNRGKDFFIEQLQKEREGYVGQLIESSKRVGELESKLLQLTEPIRLQADSPSTQE
jgi:hypothetical protein